MIRAIESPFRSRVRMGIDAMRGFTLIELMVGISVSLVVVAAAATMFSSSREVFRTASGLAETQRKARQVLEDLRNDIHKAGYMGCGGHVRQDDGGNVLNITNNTRDFLSTAPSYTGYIGGGNGIIGSDGRFDLREEMTGAEFLDGYIQEDEIDPDSSYLLLQYVESPGTPVVSGFPLSDWKNGSDAILHLPNDHDFADEEILVVSDCDSADVFVVVNDGGFNDHDVVRARGVDKNYMQSSLPGNTTVPSIAEVGRFVSALYYVGKQDGSSSGDGGDCPANTLCRKTLVSSDVVSVEPLIENVESFSLGFNMDTDQNGIADFFNINASHTHDPNMTVVSVDVSLRLRYQSWLTSEVTLPDDAKVTDRATQGVANYFTKAVVRMRIPVP